MTRVLLVLALLTLAAPASAASRIVATITNTITPAGEHRGVAYVRVSGVVRGVVAPDEDVVGLAALPKNRAGEYEYTSGFEAIVPAEGQPGNQVIYIDAENRGSAISQGALGGFLQAHATSYARVQWQTGISPGVPASAQGVGLVILRDFGRLWAGRAVSMSTGGWGPPRHEKLILGGISQSAWTVNTLIAEGFNVDPVTKGRVFDGAIAIDGLGGWLAINRLAADRGVKEPHPYLDPSGVPLQRRELLRRPATDPVYIDVANFTDFYRLRAGLTSVSHSSPTFRRYDFPSPHAVGALARCNDGQPIAAFPLRYTPYMRALVLGLQKAIGVRGAEVARSLPRSRIFTLGPAPHDVAWFNPLPGVDVKTPVLDANGWPVGGVRFPETNQPLGRPDPPSVPPVTTASISATCGNSAGWKPFTTAERAARGLTDVEAYLARYRRDLAELEAQGFVLAEDVPGMLEAARTQFLAPTP